MMCLLGTYIRRLQKVTICLINTIPAKNIIDGMMIGGLTGIEQEVYKTSSSEERQDTITENEITALPYYFKIWMPYDSSVGVVMIQSYTETGVVSLVMEKIKHFIRSYNFSILPNKFVDEEYKEHFKKFSTVDKLILTKTHLTLTGGSIIEINKQVRKWVAKEFLKLPTTPEAIQLDSKGNFIVVTLGTDWSFGKAGGVIINATPGLFSIDRDANIDTLVKDGMWGDHLYPSSMVIQNDVVYIGMRKGVYKFDLAAKKEEWLLPE